MATATMAKVPEMAVTTGVMTVRSRTGSPQKVFVAFKAAGRATVISTEAPEFLDNTNILKASSVLHAASVQFCTCPVNVTSEHMQAASVALHPDCGRYVAKQFV